MIIIDAIKWFHKHRKGEKYIFNDFISIINIIARAISIWISAVGLTVPTTNWQQVSEPLENV